MAVGPNHSRGVVGVRPDEGMSCLKGVGNRLQRDEETCVGHRTEYRTSPIPPL